MWRNFQNCSDDQPLESIIRHRETVTTPCVSDEEHSDDGKKEKVNQQINLIVGKGNLFFDLAQFAEKIEK